MKNAIYAGKIDMSDIHNFGSSSFERANSLVLPAKTVVGKVLYPRLFTKSIATRTGMNMYILFFTSQQSRRQQQHQP